MNKKLGLPYMGSKRKLAKPIVDHILQANPQVKNVYDLFGGGGAISFEFMQRNQIDKVVYNERNKGVTELLKKIQKEGVTEDFYQWISREDFFKYKDNDDWFGGLCKVVWSFGNNQRGYLFGDVEEYKRMFHEVVVYGQDNLKEMSSYAEAYVEKKYNIIVDCKLTMPISKGYQKRRLEIRSQLNKFEKDCKAKQKSITNLRQLQQLEQLQGLEQLQRLQQLQQLERLQQIEQLEGLQQLEQLQQLERLPILNKSFDEVDIRTPLENTIIYLDPPYKGTGKYQNDVDHDNINSYIKNSEYTIYVSGYENVYGLYEVDSFKHNSTLGQKSNNKVMEKLFCNKNLKVEKQEDLFSEFMSKI